MEKTRVIVGLGSCGYAAGAGKVYDHLKTVQVNEKLDFSLEKTSCIGMCYKEPLVEVVDKSGSYIYGEVDVKRMGEILEQHIKNNNPIKDYVVKTDLFPTSEDAYFQGQVKIALRNCGYIDPESIEEYEARKGYGAIKKIASEKISQQDVIKTIIDSGLRGRGGGGFSTGMNSTLSSQS